MSDIRLAPGSPAQPGRIRCRMPPEMRDRRLVLEAIKSRHAQLFRNAIASAVRLRMSSIWSVDWNPMMKALTVPSPST